MFSPDLFSGREEQSRFWARVFLGISLSVLFHVLTSIGSIYLSNLLETPQPPKRILVEWVEPSDIAKESWQQPQNQIVRKVDLPRELVDLDDLKPRRRFLSADRQTVRQETQAARSGLTENRGDSNPVRDRQAERIGESGPLDREAVREQILANDGETNIRPQPREPRELLMPADPRRNPGVSTSGELLPKDVQIGDFTALNTDRFTYYTFYARVEEQIRHRWVSFVKAALYGGGDVPAGRAEFMTNVEIVLDRSGRYLRAIVHQGSGSRDIDAAPLLAFRDARQIPNPPREMVKEDGTIRLLYAFHVDQVPPIARAGQQPEEQSE